MTPDEANEKRLYANEIIRQLYEAREKDQLRILKIAVDRSLEEIEVDRIAKMTEAELDAELEAVGVDIPALNQRIARLKGKMQRRLEELLAKKREGGGDG